MKGWIQIGVALLAIWFVTGCAPKAAAQPRGADLSLTKTADRMSVRIGENITFKITVTNHGPRAASLVVFGDVLPVSLELVSCSCSTGSVTNGSFCEVERLESGESAAATVVATAVVDPRLEDTERSVTARATIAEFLAFDPDRENNSASLPVQIFTLPKDNRP